MTTSKSTSKKPPLITQYHLSVLTCFLPYSLAVFHALETTDLTKAPRCEIHKFEGLAQPNPYHLPWIMRGLLEEEFVKTELNSETAELLRQFDDWRPTTKALKDVKYRLEAVRSKL